jgi:DNA-binding LacI/PurR family transcriptional regulator
MNRNRRRVTLEDVARRAGVSKVTVSNILNNRPTAVPISEATRQRVLAVVQELGYYPNAVARALVQKRTDTIAVVLQFPAIFQGWSGFTNELMHGVSDKAIELGYDILMHTRAQPSVEAEAQALMDGRVDGALLLRDYNDPLIELLAERGFPHVLFFTVAIGTTRIGSIAITRRGHAWQWRISCSWDIGGSPIWLARLRHAAPAIGCRATAKRWKPTG